MGDRGGESGVLEICFRVQSYYFGKFRNCSCRLEVLVIQEEILSSPQLYHSGGEKMVLDLIKGAILFIW